MCGRAARLPLGAELTDSWNPITQFHPFREVSMSARSSGASGCWSSLKDVGHLFDGEPKFFAS